MIDTGANGLSPFTTLKYFYEPLSQTRREVDTTPWLKERITWTYNNDTLNDRYDYTPRKSEGTFRIIVLGDSNTFGDHVNTADSWPEKLEDALNTQKICPMYTSYQVLNLGLRGLDIQHEIERYRIRGVKYHPDLVIWMVNDNDFTEINELLNPMVANRYIELLKEHNIDIINPYSVRTSDPSRIHIYQQAVEDGTKRFLQSYDENTRFRIQDEFIDQFNEYYLGSLLFVSYPFLGDTYKAHIRQWTSERPETAYTDSLPDINTNLDWNFSRFGDGHPTSEGHERIVKTIYHYLLTNSLIPCK
jgi:hypothetical protein